MKFYMTLIIAMLGIGLVAGTASAQDQIDYTEMVEDLKVMCRIVDETMEETFENDYVKGGFFRRGSCQHLYLTGYGPVFLLDVRFPVAEKEMKIVKTEKKTGLWEKYEREVRYQYQPEEAVWVVGKNESYSKEKVDKLKEQLAYLVGEYGSRIGQLGFEDTISFVVFGHSGHAVGDAMSHTPETVKELRKKVQEIREATKKLKVINRKQEGTAEEESQDNDKKVINPREIIIEKEIEEEKDEEIEGSQSKKGKRFRTLILSHHKPPVPPPPIPISVPHRFRSKPATTLVLTFKRSQLEGKKGADWEALLEAAEVVEY